MSTLSTIGTAILSIIQNAPTMISEAETLYTAFKNDFTNEDQAAIDAALASAQTGDSTATANADTALEAASKT